MTSSKTVSTIDDLYAALATAKGGETILLEGGDYGDFTLNRKTGFDLSFPSDVTIKSADSESPAVFNTLSINFVENLKLDGLAFDYVYESGDLTYKKPFQIRDSHNVEIINSVFKGELTLDSAVDPDGFGTAFGLYVRKSSDILIEGNEFFDWHRALIVDDTQDVIVRGNEIHNIRSDGMNFVDVQRAIIEENYIHDFRAVYESGDHRDMIQFWTNGTDTSSTDVIIRNNQLDVGEGSFAQAIFMRNEVVDSQAGGHDRFYQNVLIEGNEIYGGHLHGITVGETDGLTIRNNTLVAIADDNNPDQDGGGVWVPAINVSSAAQNVTIQSNVTSEINGHDGQNGWVVNGNAFIQNNDPFSPGYYADTFITSSMSIGENGHHFIVRAGSVVDNLSAGTSSIHQIPQAYQEVALFDVVAGIGENKMLFDASLTADMLAQAGITDATYTWKFADGHTATGAQVEHAFTHSGHHNVELAVTLSDGTLFKGESVINIRGGQVLSFDAAQSSFTASGFGVDTELAPVSAAYDNALHLGGTGTAATVTRLALDGLRGSNTLDLDFTLSGEGSGEVFRLHGSFIVTVDTDGALHAVLFNQDGTASRLESVDFKVNDGGTHDVSISLEEDQATLNIDGQTFAPADFTGTFATSGFWDLAFGNPWGKENFDGILTQFDLSVGAHLKALAVIPAPAAVEQAADAAQGQEQVYELSMANSMREDYKSNSQEEMDIAPKSMEYLVPGSVSQLVAEAAPITLDGSEEYISFGRLTEFEQSEAIGISVNFTADAANGDDTRLIWNHLKVGLTIQNDEILVQVATAEDGFKGFKTKGLGLTKGEEHTATLLVDGDTDLMQFIVNDELVLEIDDTDFDLVGGGGYQWGWSVGTQWNRYFTGEVSQLEVSDEFRFQEDIQPIAWTDDLF